MPSPQTMTDEQIERRAIAFVNTILADLDFDPVSALHPGLGGAAGSCALALTLNLATGVLPARFGLAETHTSEYAAAEPNMGFTEEEAQSIGSRMFRVDEGKNPHGGPQMMAYRIQGGPLWPTTEAVDEFVARFDAGKMPHLVLCECPTV